MTADQDPREAVRREIVKVSRRLAVLKHSYGGLDNRWTQSMIDAAEDRLTRLRHDLAELNRGHRPR